MRRYFDGKQKHTWPTSWLFDDGGSARKSREVAGILCLECLAQQIKTTTRPIMNAMLYYGPSIFWGLISGARIPNQCGPRCPFVEPKPRRFDRETLHVETPFTQIDLRVVLKVGSKIPAPDTLSWLETDGTDNRLLKNDIF